MAEKTMRWNDIPSPPFEAPNPGGWLRCVIRSILILPFLFIPLPLVIVLRLIGANHIAQTIVQTVCKIALFILGLRVKYNGTPAPSSCIVSNHTSWLDIFVLNSQMKFYFIAKSEVANWPLIGIISRGTGTIFVERARRQAAKQRDMLCQYLKRGDRFLFFPEGTSTNGLRVISFKPTLFAALFDTELVDKAVVQPITLRYHAPLAQRPDFYGWWDQISFAQSWITFLSQKQQGHIEITFHPALPVADYENRHALATACENTVRDGLIAML